jgi:MFS family permease
VIAAALHINQDAQLVLLTSGYLLGYVFGPLVFGPLSEIYGRRAVLIPTFFAFCLFTLACALSTTWSMLVVFRVITGILASAPITIVGGVYADIYDNPVHRGRAMAAFLAVFILFGI